jgi:hypothetical protein
MALYYLAIYHNADSRFLPYQPGHALTKVISHRRHLPARTSAEQIADRAYHLFNADLDQLQGDRRKTEDEMDFLLACAYRLLGRRSVSTGDVIGLTTPENATWLACERISWRHIASPENHTGRGLIAATVYEHLRRGDDE